MGALQASADELQAKMAATEAHLAAVAAAAHGGEHEAQVPAGPPGAAAGASTVGVAVQALLQRQAELRSQVGELQLRCSGLGASNEELRCARPRLADSRPPALAVPLAARCSVVLLMLAVRLVRCCGSCPGARGCAAD